MKVMTEQFLLDETTPVIRAVMINNIMVSNANACAGFIYGLPGQKVESIRFLNCSIKMNTDGNAEVFIK